MADRFSEAVLELRTDETDYKRGLDAADREAARFDRRLQRMGKNLEEMGFRTARVGKALSVSLTAPLLGAGAASLKLASDAVEAGNKFDVVMGPAADSARARLGELTSQIPLTRSELENMSAGIQDMLVPMGVARTEAAGMSVDMVELAGDLGSFNNVGTDRVLEAIQSALAGSSEPMRRFGVDTRVARLEQIALREGLIEQGEELDNTSRAQAVLLAIQEDSADAMGDAARTSDEYANSVRFLWRDVRDLSQMLGEVLIPATRPWINQAREWLGELKELNPEQQRLIAGVGGIGAATGPALFVLGKGVQTTGRFAEGIGKIGQEIRQNGGALAVLSRGLGTVQSTGLGAVRMLLGPVGLVAGITALVLSSPRARRELGEMADGALSMGKRLVSAAESWWDNSEAVDAYRQAGSKVVPVLRGIWQWLENIDESLEDNEQGWTAAEARIRTVFPWIVALDMLLPELEESLDDVDKKGLHPLTQSIFNAGEELQQGEGMLLSYTNTYRQGLGPLRDFTQRQDDVSDAADRFQKRIANVRERLKLTEVTDFARGVEELEFAVRNGIAPPEQLRGVYEKFRSEIRDAGYLDRYRDRLDELNWELGQTRSQVEDITFSRIARELKNATDLTWNFASAQAAANETLDLGAVEALRQEEAYRNWLATQYDVSRALVDSILARDDLTVAEQKAALQLGKSLTPEVMRSVVALGAQLEIMQAISRGDYAEAIEIAAEANRRLAEMAGGAGKSFTGSLGDQLKKFFDRDFGAIMSDVQDVAQNVFGIRIPAIAQAGLNAITKFIQGDWIGAIISGFSGLVGAIKGLFGGPSGTERVARDFGKFLGIQISEGLAETLAERFTKDGKNNMIAAFRGLPDIMREIGSLSGQQLSAFLDQGVKSLLIGLQQGKIRADEFVDAFKTGIPILLQQMKALADQGVAPTNQQVEDLNTALNGMLVRVEQGYLSTAQAQEILEASFPDLMAVIGQMGDRGNEVLAELMDRAERLGIEIDFVAEATDRAETAFEDWQEAQQRVSSLRQELADLRTEWQQFGQADGPEATRSWMNDLGARTDVSFREVRERWQALGERMGWTAQQINRAVTQELTSMSSEAAAGFREYGREVMQLTGPALEEFVAGSMDQWRQEVRETEREQKRAAREAFLEQKRELRRQILEARQVELEKRQVARETLRMMKRFNREMADDWAARMKEILEEARQLRADLVGNSEFPDMVDDIEAEFGRMETGWGSRLDTMAAAAGSRFRTPVEEILEGLEDSTDSRWEGMAIGWSSSLDRMLRDAEGFHRNIVGASVFPDLVSDVGGEWIRMRSDFAGELGGMLGEADRFRLGVVPRLDMDAFERHLWVPDVAAGARSISPAGASSSGRDGGAATDRELLEEIRALRRELNTRWLGELERIVKHAGQTIVRRK